MASSDDFQITEDHLNKSRWAKEMLDGQTTNSISDNSPPTDFTKKLSSEDIEKFGSYVCIEDLRLVKCIICRKFIKLNWFSSHIIEFHESAENYNYLAGLTPSQTDSAYGSEDLVFNGGISDLLWKSSEAKSQQVFSGSLFLSRNSLSSSECNSIKNCDSSLINDSLKRHSAESWTNNNKKLKPSEEKEEDVFSCSNQELVVSLQEECAAKTGCDSSTFNEICDNPLFTPEGCSPAQGGGSPVPSVSGQTSFDQSNLDSSADISDQQDSQSNFLGSESNADTPSNCKEQSNKN